MTLQINFSRSWCISCRINPFLAELGPSATRFRRHVLRDSCRSGHTCDCGHLIVLNNCTPFEIVRIIGELPSSHFDRAMTAFHWIANEGIYFGVTLIYDTGVITCNSSPLALSEKLHSSTLVVLNMVVLWANVRK